MNHPPSPEINNSAATGGAAECLSKGQVESLRAIEAGFTHEKRSGTDQPAWEPLFPHGAIDEDGSVWVVWVNSSRKHEAEGWKVRRCLKGEGEFKKVLIADVTITSFSWLNTEQDYSTSQLWTEKGCLNVVFVDKDVQMARAYSQHPMEPLQPRPEASIGKKALNGAGVNGEHLAPAA